MTITDLRDYTANPITATEAISLFRNEDSDLVFATAEIIAEAERLAEAEGAFYIAGNIGSRWDDYQEELRVLMAQARAEFGC